VNSGWLPKSWAEECRRRAAIATMSPANAKLFNDRAEAIEQWIAGAKR